jgi:hypothetical protein
VIAVGRLKPTLAGKTIANQTRAHLPLFKAFQYNFMLLLY